MGKYYIWFVVVVAGLAGLIRLLLPRRFAELQLERFKGANAISKAKMRSLLFLAVGVVFGGIYFLPWGHQSWIVIGTVFSVLSAAEAYFQAQFPRWKRWSSRAACWEFCIWGWPPALT